MSAPLLVGFLLFWATLMRALVVKGRVLPPTCARCGLRYERSGLGQQVCRCHEHDE